MTGLLVVVGEARDGPGYLWQTNPETRMFSADRLEIDELFARAGRRSPILAILDSGLDPFAALPPGTQVLAARSFVGGNPSHDPLGWGTGWAQLYSRAITDRWTPDGRATVKLVIAQVVDRDGRGHPEALAAALAWTAQFGAHTYIAPWLEGFRELERVAPARALQVLQGGLAS